MAESGHLGKNTGMIKQQPNTGPVCNNVPLWPTDKIFVFISLQWSIFLKTCSVAPWTDKKHPVARTFYTLNCPYLKNNFLFVCSETVCKLPLWEETKEKYLLTFFISLTILHFPCNFSQSFYSFWDENHIKGTRQCLFTTSFPDSPYSPFTALSCNFCGPSIPRTLIIIALDPIHRCKRFFPHDLHFTLLKLRHIISLL